MTKPTGKRRNKKRKSTADNSAVKRTADVSTTDDGFVPNWIRRQAAKARAKAAA